MAIDRAKFFDGIRNGPFPGSLSEGAVQGISAILDEWERRGLTDLRWLAYMLATVLAECGRNMLPVREGFKRTDAQTRNYVLTKGYKYAVEVNGQVYYGRGLVQLTWVDNYRKMSAITGIDLVNDPDRALEPAVAAKIMFEGMIRGTFTGRKLADYFHGQVADWTNARKIINGLDRAGEIAGYGKQFYADLVEAGTSAPASTPKLQTDKPTAVAAGGGAAVITGTIATGADKGWGATEWLIAAVVIGVTIAAAWFGWNWWKRRQEREAMIGDAGLAAVADEFSKPEPDTDTPASEADSLAAAIASRARGAVACQEAVTSAMARPVRRRNPPKKPKKPAKRRANKKRKAS